MNIFYEYGNNLYVNLTNECSMNCTFCERQYTDKIGAADTLWLDHEPTMIEVLTELSKKNIMQYKELVFCGFGEPTERLSLVLDVAAFVKKHSNITIRLNTNGMANLIAGTDVTDRLVGLIDIVSISMNASNPETYYKLTQSKFGIESFDAMIEFAKSCKAKIKKVVMTTVSTTITEEEEKECARICNELGVEYQIREYEDHGSGVFPTAIGAGAVETEEAPVEETPVEAAPVEEAPVEETPVEEVPVEEAPVEEAPVEETPVEEAPVEEAPVEEAPVEEAPVEEAPVEETPVEAAPVEEAPVEEAVKPARPARPEGGRSIMLYLASGSPRRKELLESFDIPFEVVPSNVVEDTTGLTPGEAVLAVSKAKATAIAEEVPGPAVIVAADTLVSLHGDIFGKPKDEAEAIEMLQNLQGDQHRVYTGVTIIIKARAGFKMEQFSDFTKVRMVEMSDKEIENYVKTGEPLDKAGAYAIQGIGCRYIESIEGNYTTVVGMPMHILYEKLKAIRGVFPNR